MSDRVLMSNSMNLYNLNILNCFRYVHCDIWPLIDVFPGPSAAPPPHSAGEANGETPAKEKAPEDSRGDLLSAIRNANKAKLKSAEERKRDKKEEIKKNKECVMFCFAILPCFDLLI